MVLFLYVSIFTRESSARGSLTAVDAREVKIPVPARGGGTLLRERCECSAGTRDAKRVHGPPRAASPDSFVIISR